MCIILTAKNVAYHSKCRYQTNCRQRPHVNASILLRRALTQGRGARVSNYTAIAHQAQAPVHLRPAVPLLPFGSRAT